MSWLAPLDPIQTTTMSSVQAAKSSAEMPASRNLTAVVPTISPEDVLRIKNAGRETAVMVAAMMTTMTTVATMTMTAVASLTRLRISVIT
jgi:hypothetical protein